MFLQGDQDVISPVWQSEHILPFCSIQISFKPSDNLSIFCPFVLSEYILNHLSMFYHTNQSVLLSYSLDNRDIFGPFPCQNIVYFSCTSKHILPILLVRTFLTVCANLNVFNLISQSIRCLDHLQFEHILPYLPV